jgi:hypothetical protein
MEEKENRFEQKAGSFYYLYLTPLEKITNHNNQITNKTQNIKTQNIKHV